MNITPPRKTGPVAGTAALGDLVTTRTGTATYYIFAVHPDTDPYRYTIADTETGQTVQTNLTHPDWQFVD